MKKNTVTITGFNCEHKRAYPAAQHKRIYARPFTKTVVLTKAITTLARILED